MIRKTQELLFRQIRFITTKPFFKKKKTELEMLEDEL